MYDRFFLTSERLDFIFENCPDNLYIYLNIHNFIKMLFKNYENELLDIIFNRFKFFDIETIKLFLLHYKNQMSLTSTNLNKLIDKCTISRKNKYGYNFFFNDYGNIFTNIPIPYIYKHGYNLIFDEYTNKHNIFASISWIDKHSKFEYFNGCLIDYLINACEKENIYIVKFLVDIIYNINEFDSSGKTALFYACEKGNESIVKYLIEHGAKIDIEDFEKVTVFDKACESGNLNIINYLIEQGINIKNKVIEDSLFYACKSGNERIVQRLIELGADLNKEKFMGYIPFYEACKSKKTNKNIVKLFIENGVNINKEDELGITPIFYACLSGNKDIVNYLIEQEVDIDINKEDINGQTLLFYACKGGNESIVHKFVELGSDINKEDIDGQTPLFEACKGNNENVLKYLVEHGADIHKENIFGETALFYACERGNEAKAVVKYLVEHGANVNKVDKNNQTPLYRAFFPRYYEIINDKIKFIEHLYMENIYWRNESIVNYLIEHGANINKICTYCIAWDGVTESKRGYHFEGAPAINEKIFKMGYVQILNKEMYNETFLTKARKEKKERIVKCLVENGANPKNVTNPNEGNAFNSSFIKNSFSFIYRLQKRILS